MKAQATYNLLEFIDENDGFYKEDVVRLIKFINQDVYKTIQLRIEEFAKNENDSRSSDKIAGWRQDRASLEKFLDVPENSVLVFLTEMIKDKKSDFCDYFFDKAKRFLYLIDEGLYEENDFNPITFTFNFYVMLKAYSVYKDDLDKYKEFCNDFNFLIEKRTYFLGERYSYVTPFYEEKKNIINTIIEMNKFDEFPILKTYLINLVKDMTKHLAWENKTYVNCLNNLKYVKSIEEDTKVYFDHPMFNKEVYNGILGGVFNKLEEEKGELFYAPILSLGDRYQYINSAFGKYIDNKNLFLDLIDSVNQFDNGLFDYLNEINKDGKDSFISCMELVFDSDSFYEVKAKLCFLISASVSFGHNNISDALSKIKQMSTDETKKVLLGKIISTEANTVNQIEKPVDIYSRSCVAYNNAFGDFIFDIKSKIQWTYRSANSFDSLDSKLSSYVEEQKAYYDKQERKRLEEEKKKQEEKLEQESKNQSDRVAPLVDDVIVESAIVFDKPKEETGFSKIKSMFTKRG